LTELKYLLEYSWYLYIWRFVSAGKMFCTNW